MARNPNKALLQIQLSQELKNRLERVAEFEGRSMTQQLQIILDWGLRLRENQIEDVDSPIHLPNNLSTNIRPASFGKQTMPKG